MREALGEILAELDFALYRTFKDSRDGIDIHQMQGAGKVIERLRDALSQAAPQPFER